MIEKGQRKKAKYWGNFTVRKVAKLKSPILCYSKDIGEVEFMPTIVQIEWETPPSSDKNEFWFPYWITTSGKEKYGQFAPMIGEGSLLELFESAIKQSFFTKGFLLKLRRYIEDALN